jgi:hypothetical protein
MFNTSISLDTLNSWGHGNMIEVLGIEFIDVQPDFIKELLTAPAPNALMDVPLAQKSD